MWILGNDLLNDNGKSSATRYVEIGCMMISKHIVKNYKLRHVTKIRIYMALILIINCVSQDDDTS